MLIYSHDNLLNTMSENQSDIFENPLLLSVKEEDTSDNGDSDHHFSFDENINNVDQKPEINNPETDNCFFKEEPEDLDNSFQPNGTVQRKADDNFEVKIEYDYKTTVIKRETIEDTVFESEIVIEKETIGDTVFESKIVIENSGIQSILNEEKCNTGHGSNFTDLPRKMYKDLVNCNNETDQNKRKREKCIYTCDVCHQSFITKQLIISHMRDHFPKRAYNIECKKITRKRPKKTIFPCPICGKQFNDYSNCRRHTMNHDKTNKVINKVKCLVCEKHFATRYNFRVHMRIHTGESPYECDVCHLTFRRNDDLLKHIMKHEVNEETYDCKDCHKQFLHNHCLLRHVRRNHQMENIYSCWHCQKSYLRKDSLIVHMRSKHTGEKPYKCHICKKDFFEKNVLVRHIKIHKKGSSDEENKSNQRVLVNSVSTRPKRLQKLPKVFKDFIM